MTESAAEVTTTVVDTTGSMLVTLYKDEDGAESVHKLPIIAWRVFEHPDSSPIPITAAGEPTLSARGFVTFIETRTGVCVFQHDCDCPDYKTALAHAREKLLARR